jgi:hypothetical protein
LVRDVPSIPPPAHNHYQVYQTFFVLKITTHFSETPTLNLPRNITFTVIQTENFILKLDVRTLNPWYFKHGKVFFWWGGGGGMCLFIHICSAIVLFLCVEDVRLLHCTLLAIFSPPVRLLPFENLSNTVIDWRLLFVCTTQINNSDPTNELTAY